MVSTRPLRFGFDIASGVLESMGLNMYTSIGKSLSEFVANAYDADAGRVDITIPFERISEARGALRQKVKAEIDAGTRDRLDGVIVEPLPEDIQIVVQDSGHGMSPEDITNKFLVVSRNRRKESSTSESGRRPVMGRKGLGKLAGFGTAIKITIRSKRKGDTFATQFTMNYSEIEQEETIYKHQFEAKYIEDLPLDDQGTTIILTSLRCDSLKASEGTVRATLAQNFAILRDTFEVFLNGKRIEEEPAEFEFLFPPEDERDADGFGVLNVAVGDMASFPIRYIVRFRARDTDIDGTQRVPKVDEQGRVLKRGNLPTALRGARIYCNKRLAAGPTLLNLHTGMHNFHSQAYMECIVHADEIDKQAIDHIGTNRADLKGDSDVVEALKDAVTEVMKDALYQHSKFRDQKAIAEVEKDEFTRGLMLRLPVQSTKTRAATRNLLHSLAATAGVGSQLYKTAAPLVLESMNAGEVLTSLVKEASDPTSLVAVANELFELARLENLDVLKLYRARRHGIEAVRKLIERAQISWKKGERFEKDLHKTLKENPWLIKAEFSRYLTSDVPLGDVAKQISAHLNIDENSPQLEEDEEGNIVDEDNRPDLVFAMTDSSTATIVTIVELKTPNYPLKIEHLNQLNGYIMRVEEWLKGKFHTPILVRGFLIGSTDDKSKSQSVMLLNRERLKSTAHSQVEIIPLTELLERAKRIHLESIEALEKTESYYDAQLSIEKAGN